MEESRILDYMIPYKNGSAQEQHFNCMTASRGMARPAANLSLGHNELHTCITYNGIHNN